MLASPSSTPETALPAYSPGPKITRGHSCILCQQRKVRCDRQKPCSNCIKARVECLASNPTLARRRKKKVAETDVFGKLKRYEQLLKSNGIKIEEDEEETHVIEPLTHGGREGVTTQAVWNERATIGLSIPRGSGPGTLFIHKEEAHYVENTLWENLKDEIADTKNGISDQSSSEDEASDEKPYPDAENFLLGNQISSKKLTGAHPSPVHIFRLWQTFLINVHPLIMMFHAPTVQQLVLDATANLDAVPRPVEALMFSIYLLAVESLNDGACEAMFGESKVALIRKYSHAAQQALINSKFLKSLNLYTLQAYICYIVGVRKFYDAHSIWVLTGSGVRIAQRLGLHRDGSRYKISVFDAEIRRRTWWTMIFLDGNASKLAGAGFPSWLIHFDTKIPLNISDSDLSPEMKTLPQEKKGATEMMFCSIKYEVAGAIRKAGVFAKDSISQVFNQNHDPRLIGVKDKAIDELEKTLEEKYVRYCDASIPLHILIKYMAKSVILLMRLMAHHPRQYADKGASMPQSERDMLFELSMATLEIDGYAYTDKTIQGYVWHISQYFSYDGLIYLLGELSIRIKGESVDRAWRLVKNTYEHHVEMLGDTKNPLYVAIGNLCLKAWRRREEAGIISQNGYDTTTPQFINRLRELRKGLDLAKPGVPIYKSREEITAPLQNLHMANHESHNTTSIQDILQQSSQEFANIDLDLDMEMPEMTSVDWEYWQTLIDANTSYGDGGENYIS